MDRQEFVELAEKLGLDGAKLLRDRRSFTGKIAAYARIDGDPEKRKVWRAELDRVNSEIEAVIAAGAQR